LVFSEFFHQPETPIQDFSIREVCVRGRHCVAPRDWSRNLFVHPPSDADFPVEVAEKFDDGQPWFDIMEDFLTRRIKRIPLD
jgi:hypothetical protein